MRSMSRSMERLLLRIVNEVNVTVNVKVRLETFRILRCVKVLRMRVSKGHEFSVFVR